MIDLLINKPCSIFWGAIYRGSVATKLFRWPMVRGNVSSGIKSHALGVILPYRPSYRCLSEQVSI